MKYSKLLFRTQCNLGMGMSISEVLKDIREQLDKNEKDKK